MSIDFERLKHDRDYWDSVAPEGATHYVEHRTNKWHRNVGATWVHYDYGSWSWTPVLPDPDRSAIAKPTKGNYVGAVVKYIKKHSARYGWTGVVVSQREARGKETCDRIRVQFDNGKIQDYALPALTGEPRATHLPHDEPIIDQYLTVTGWADEVPESGPRTPTHIVKGAKGGGVHECFTESDARELAHQKAQDSRSGQAYQVYAIVCEYQREEPPVNCTELGE